MATKYEWWSPGLSGADNTYGDRWSAQTFTIGYTGTNENFDIGLVKLNGFRIGSPGTLSVSIKAVDGNNEPTGADLSTGTFDADTLTSGWPPFQFEVEMSSYELQASTQYAIVLKVLGGDSSNKYQPATNGGYGGGKYQWSTDAGINWQDGGGSNDMNFEIWSADIPAGFTRKIKIAGTFQDKPIKTKVSGTFEDKPIKIKVGGTFQDA